MDGTGCAQPVGVQLKTRVLSTSRQQHCMCSRQITPLVWVQDAQAESCMHKNACSKQPISTSVCSRLATHIQHYVKGMSKFVCLPAVCAGRQYKMLVHLQQSNKPGPWCVYNSCQSRGPLEEAQDMRDIYRPQGKQHLGAVGGRQAMDMLAPFNL